MQFNWLDYVLLGILAVVAGIQFLRRTKDFSRVFYETALMVGAATVHRSLVARDLLYFKTFIGVRTILRFARWKNLQAALRPN